MSSSISDIPCAHPVSIRGQKISKEIKEYKTTWNAQLPDRRRVIAQLIEIQGVTKSPDLESGVRVPAPLLVFQGLIRIHIEFRILRFNYLCIDSGDSDSLSGARQ